MAKKSKHEILLREIRDRLNDSRLEYVLSCNVIYSRGELDLMAEHEGSLLVFEVKSRSRPRARERARRQLDRAHKYYEGFTHYKKVYFFGVYGLKEGSYEIRRYRPEEQSDDLCSIK